MKDISIDVDADICIGAALALLLLPLQWLTAFFAAAAIHELCHIAAIYFNGGRILDIRIGMSGMRIDTQFSTAWSEFFSALAGPAGSFLLILLIRVFPRLAVCGCIHGIFNLIPVYPMDGGRALYCMASNLFSEKVGRRMIILTEGIALVALTALSVWGAIYMHMGILTLLVGGMIAHRMLLGKFSCKEACQRVQ